MINKIDLPGAEPELAKEQIEQVIGIDASGAIPASAKLGIGIDEILEAIVQRIPPPQGDPDGPSAASSSTPGSTSTAASSCCCTWWTAGSSRA